MKILDKYIAREFLVSFTYSILSFGLLFIVIKIFEELSKVISSQMIFLDAVKYFLYQLPFTIGLITPIASLLGVLLSLSRLSRHNEIIAMRSSGVSYYRIVWVVAGLGLIASIAFMMFAQIVVPRAQTAFKEIKNVKMHKRPPSFQYGRKRRFAILGEGGRLYYIDLFDGDKSTMNGVSIHEFFPQTNVLQRRIDAKSARWTDSSWEFSDGIIREFGEDGGMIKEEAFKNKVIRLEEDPRLFRREPKSVENMEMTFSELRAYIGRVKNSGGNPQQEMVDLHLRYVSYHFSNFLIALLGIPLAIRYHKGGAGLSFGLSIAIAFVYYGTVVIFRAIGLSGGLHPLIATWLPNVIFAFLAIGANIVARK